VSMVQVHAGAGRNSEVERNCATARLGWSATGGELAVRRMTNLFRRDAVASLLIQGEAWKEPMALRRLRKRLSDGSRG
jgi:hypothetical protein